MCVILHFSFNYMMLACWLAWILNRKDLRAETAAGQYFIISFCNFSERFTTLNTLHHQQLELIDRVQRKSKWHTGLFDAMERRDVELRISLGFVFPPSQNIIHNDKQLSWFVTYVPSWWSSFILLVPLIL